METAAAGQQGAVLSVAVVLRNVGSVLLAWRVLENQEVQRWKSARIWQNDPPKGLNARRTNPT